MLTVTTIEELRTRAGQELGASAYHDVSQDRVNAFAEATGDRQWIHPDPVRARDTPMGGTIAHRYCTLAPALLAEVLPLDGFAMGVNYGLDKLRFPAPLPVGSALRMRARLDACDDIPGGATLALTLTFEHESSDRPACVAQALYRVDESA
jgi:acyl dehydratase